MVYMSRALGVAASENKRVMRGQETERVVGQPPGALEMAYRGSNDNEPCPLNIGLSAIDSVDETVCFTAYHDT